MAAASEIQDNEKIIRLCYAPQFWDDEKNEPKPALFSDAFEPRKMSVLRQHMITEAALNIRRQQLLKQKEERKPRPDLIAKVSKIKRIKNAQKQQIFQIEASPAKTVGGQAHADLFAKEKYRKQEIRQYRAFLADCFETGADKG